jgi:hypothetical protein
MFNQVPNDIAYSFPNYAEGPKFGDNMTGMLPKMNINVGILIFFIEFSRTLGWFIPWETIEIPTA